MSKEVETILTSKDLSLCLLHDILSPLSCILLSADLLAKSENIPRECIPIIKELKTSSSNTKNFIRLIQLHLRGKISHSNINICKEIQHALEIVRGFALKEGIEIDFLRPNAIYGYISPLYVQQICMNLVCNSVDAYKDNDIKKFKNNLNIRKKIIFMLKKDEKCITISCEDFAGGIPLDIQSKIFRDQVTSKKNGCGYGLYNIYDIVKNKLGGKISINTKSGIGTIFNIEIPISKTKNHNV